MRLLLDTHVLVWLMNGDSTLSSSTREEINAASADRETLVSAISFWEIGMLQVKNRLHLDSPAPQWMEMVVNQPGITVTPFTPEIAVACSFLPGSLHQDPADRMIVTTARETGATLITRDSRILRYGAQGHVQVMEA